MVHRTLVALLLASVCLNNSLDAATPIRKKLQRPGRRKSRSIAAAGACINTVQGRWLVADDKGMVCERGQLDNGTGCCAAGKQFTCQTCSKDDRCCSLYEHCVSCCLNPDNNMDGELANTFRSRDRPESGRWKSIFEMCRGRCRTTSNSTVHENEYISPRHFCFSDAARPLLPPFPLQPPEGVMLQRSTKGESCEAACARLGGPSSPGGWRCAKEFAKHTNNCNIMRQYFICQAGCEISEGGDQPSYVMSDAPKTHRPTTCFIHDPATLDKGFDCAGLHAQTQRLCPCHATPEER